jgi:hypothetical protein
MTKGNETKHIAAHFRKSSSLFDYHAPRSMEWIPRLGRLQRSEAPTKLNKAMELNRIWPGTALPASGGMTRANRKKLAFLGPNMQDFTRCDFES